MAEEAITRSHLYIDGRWANRKFKGKRRKRGRPKLRKTYKNRKVKRRQPRPDLTPEHMAMLRAKVTTGRAGVPDGMRKAEAMVLWTQAREKADWLMAELEKAEVISFDPKITEEQMAREALKEAFVMVMSPMGAQTTKLAAIRTVLEWTKAKPASKTDLKISTAERWLEEVVVDHQRSLPAPSETPVSEGLQVLGAALREDQD